MGADLDVFAERLDALEGPVQGLVGIRDEEDLAIVGLEAVFEETGFGENLVFAKGLDLFDGGFLLGGLCRGFLDGFFGFLFDGRGFFLGFLDRGFFLHGFFFLHGLFFRDGSRFFLGFLGRLFSLFFGGFLGRGFFFLHGFFFRDGSGFFFGFSRFFRLFFNRFFRGGFFLPADEAGKQVDAKRQGRGERDEGDDQDDGSLGFGDVARQDGVETEGEKIGIVDREDRDGDAACDLLGIPLDGDERHDEQDDE